MHGRQDREGMHTAAERLVAALGGGACPPLGEALSALAAAWRPVDRAGVDSRLDELARPLFDPGPEAEDRALGLAELTERAFRPDTSSANGLLLDEVLDTGRGHPVVIAAIAAELGQRAGWEVAVSSTPTTWYAGLLVAGRLWLIDTTGGTGLADGAPPLVRRHCAHEVAFAVLTGLAERFRRPRDVRRALELRGHLDFPAPARRAGESLLGTLWAPRGASW